MIGICSEPFARWEIYSVLETREFSCSDPDGDRGRSKIGVFQIILPEHSNLILKTGSLG